MSHKRRPESSPPTLKTSTTGKQVKKPRLETTDSCQTVMSHSHQDQVNVTKPNTGVSPDSPIDESTAAGSSPEDTCHPEDSGPDVMATERHMTDAQSPKEKETGEVSPHKSPSQQGSSKKSKKKPNWKHLQDNSGERGGKGKKKKSKKRTVSKDQTEPVSPDTQKYPRESDTELAEMSDNKQDREISASHNLEGPTTELQFKAEQNMEELKTEEKCESKKEVVSELKTVSDSVETYGQPVEQTTVESECTASRTAEKDEGEQRRDKMEEEDELESTKRPETVTEHGKNTETEPSDVNANEVQEVAETGSDKTVAQAKMSLPDSDFAQKGSESTDCDNTQPNNIPSDQVNKLTESRTTLESDISEDNSEATQTEYSRTVDNNSYSGGNTIPGYNSTCDSTGQAAMAPLEHGAYSDSSQLDWSSLQENIEHVHIIDSVAAEKISTNKEEKLTSDDSQDRDDFREALDQDQYSKPTDLVQRANSQDRGPFKKALDQDQLDKTTPDLMQRADNTTIPSTPPGIKIEVPTSSGLTGLEEDVSSSMKTENDSPSVQPKNSDLAEMEAKQSQDYNREQAEVVKSIGGSISHEKGQDQERKRVNDTGSGPRGSKYGFKGDRKDKRKGNGQNMKGQSGLSSREDKDQMVGNERPVDEQHHSVNRQDTGKGKGTDQGWQKSVITRTLQGNVCHKQKADSQDSRQRGGKNARVQEHNSERETESDRSGVGQNQPVHDQKQSKIHVKEKVGEDMGRKKTDPSASAKNLENNTNLREASQVVDTPGQAKYPGNDDGDWVEVKRTGQEGKTDTDHSERVDATETCLSEKQTSGNKFSDHMNEQGLNGEELTKTSGKGTHTGSNLEETENADNKTKPPTKAYQKSPLSTEQGGQRSPRKLSKRLQRLEKTKARQQESLQQEQKIPDQKEKVHEDKSTNMPTVSQSVKSAGLSAAKALPVEDLCDKHMKDVDYPQGKKCEETQPGDSTSGNDGSKIFDESWELGDWVYEPDTEDNSKSTHNKQKKMPDSTAQIDSSSTAQNMPKGEVKSPGEGKGSKKRHRKWKKIDLDVGNQRSEGKKTFREPAKKSNFETPTDNTQPEKRRSRWSETGRDRSPRSYSPRGRDWDVYAHESKVVTSDSGEKFSLFFGWQNPLSQHHPARFEIEGVQYNCTEQYMMREKAVMFRDPAMLKRIMSTNDPKEQKRCGRQVQGFDVDVWEQHCWDVVEKANLAKFSQNEKLKKAIFETAGTFLVEASPWDQKWGIGLKATDSRARNRETWDGENWLGQILTAVRDMLMAQEGYADAASALNSYKECKQKAQSGQRSDILTTPKKGRSPRGTSPRGRKPYDESVVVTSETGEKITLFFGRNNPLSQFYQANLQIEGYTYNCAEQYVMYHKAALFEDYDMADQIMEKRSPREQERCGEKIKGFDAETWDQYAWGYLETANMEKFTQNQELKKVLFATVGTTLAEASPYDRKWGIGLKADDPRACNPNTWLGENWLGQILMTVRDQLMANEGYAWSLSTEESYTHQSSQVSQANPGEHEYKMEKSAEGHSNQNKDNVNEARTERSSQGYPDQHIGHWSDIKSEGLSQGQSYQSGHNLNQSKMEWSPQGQSDQSKQNSNETRIERSPQGQPDQSKQNFNETRIERSHQSYSDQSKQNWHEPGMKRSPQGQSDQSRYNKYRRDGSPRGFRYDQSRDNWNRDRSHSSQYGGQHGGREQSKLQHESRTVTSDNGETFTVFFGFSNPLSQHYGATFVIDGVKYNCIQQYIMKKKADLFGDHSTGSLIMSKQRPRVQEECGRMIKGVDEEMWEKHCWDYTEKANIAKFTQNETLRKALFDTAGTTIVEAIPWDKKGGIGLRVTDPGVCNRSTWCGENKIGNILTRVRDQLMAE